MRHKTMTLLAAIFFISAVSQSAHGQDYKSSIGIGLGADMSVNFKHFIGKRSALELQGGYNVPRHGAMFSLVYQYHVPVVTGLSFYCGGGVNVGGLDLKHNDTAVFAIGIDPTVGFEYSFAGAPIALAVDYKPNINFTTAAQWNIAAFKVRFTW